MEHELGPEISVDGMPSWLGGDEVIMGKWSSGWYTGRSAPANCYAAPDDITSIRLRADHPYYLATSKGFTYWPGGADAPDDWDGGEVLLRHGGLGSGIRWSCIGFPGDIIGYRKRSDPDAPTRPSDELVERMVAFIKEYGRYDTVARAILSELNPDPMIQRARDICKDEFGVILPDDSPGMRAVLRGLREGGA